MKNQLDLRRELNEIEIRLQLARMERDILLDRLRKEEAVSDYKMWFATTFGANPPVPESLPSTSWTLHDEWGKKVNIEMVNIEVEYASFLIQELNSRGVPGAIVEFGVFEGFWLGKIIDICKLNKTERNIYGFDSFEGLPCPSSTHDLDCWHEGEYTASIESVQKRLGVDENKHVILVQGWFKESLQSPSALNIDSICYARIDCDLYQPAVECLDYLSPRLSDGAILVFDDWTFRLDKGETKAFSEFKDRAKHLDYEFLCYTSIGHLYIRVKHKS